MIMLAAISETVDCSNNVRRNRAGGASVTVEDPNTSSEEDIAELHSIDKTLHFRCCQPSASGWGSLRLPDCLDTEKA